RRRRTQACCQRRTTSPPWPQRAKRERADGRCTKPTRTPHAQQLVLQQRSPLRRSHAPTGEGGRESAVRPAGSCRTGSTPPPSAATRRCRTMSRQTPCAPPDQVARTARSATMTVIGSTFRSVRGNKCDCNEPRNFEKNEACLKGGACVIGLASHLLCWAGL